MTRHTDDEKARKQPPMKELKKILSMRMFAFFVPTREQISVVCCGVYALKLTSMGDDMLTAVSTHVFRS